MAKLKFRKLDDHTPLMWGMMALHAVLLARRARRGALHGRARPHRDRHEQPDRLGPPHVFAVFLIVAASGALNVASISSVFNRLRLQALRAPFRHSGDCLAGRRPDGAGARSRPARAHVRRDDPQ